MAGDKNPKARKNKYADPKTGEFRHSDGDRRHRRGASAKDAIKFKKQMQGLDASAPESEQEEPQGGASE